MIVKNVPILLDCSCCSGSPQTLVLIFAAVSPAAVMELLRVPRPTDGSVRAAS